MTATPEDEFTELVNARFGRVDLVGKAANGLSFLIAKSADDTPAVPTPAELFGQTKKAPMTASVAKADDLDPTVALAEVDTDAPGDPADPGSPAWEAIDAATAMKWTAILYRALNALQVMADREAVEAAVGDSDDVGAIFDLADAAQAVDYAVGILAQFGADEWNASELAAEADAVTAVGKAAAALEAALPSLDTVEGFGPIVKAGRVLSASNEAAIKSAVESLQGVLASLPTAPTADTESVAKTKETTVAESTTDEAPEVDVAKQTTDTTEPTAVEAPAADVVKADGDKPTMQGVYNADGDLVGVCDPADITPLAPAAAPAASDKTDDDTTPDAEPNADAAPTEGDAAAADPATVGTPADANNVTKSEHDERVEEVIAKSEALAAEVDVLKAEIERLGSRAPSRVITNGQVPPAHLLRGQNTDDSGVAAVTKSSDELRDALKAAQTAPERDAIAKEMNDAGVAALAALHAQQ